MRNGNKEDEPNNSLHEYFPTSYEIRPQQKEIIQAITNGINKRSIIFVEAPPGTGKTIASLAGVLPFIHFHDGRIYWLGAYRNIYRNLTKDIQTLNREKSSNLLLSLFIQKFSMCFVDYKGKMTNFYDFCSDLREEGKCPFFNNTYKTDADGKKIEVQEETDRFIQTLTTNFLRGKYDSQELTWAEIVKQECEQRYCPYEIMKLLVQQTDIFAGDYNYVFLQGIKRIMDETVGLFSPKYKVLIIDEADKFHERLLEQLTVKLTSAMIDRLKTRLISEIGRLRRELSDALPTFEEHLEFVDEFDREISSYITDNLHIKPQKRIKISKHSFLEYLAKKKSFDLYYNRLSEIVRDAYSEEKWSSRIDDFLVLWHELDEENFVRTAENQSSVEKGHPRNTRYSIEIHPLNVHKIPLYFSSSKPVYLADILKEFTDLVFISATLYPDIFTKRMGLADWKQAICKVTKYHIPPENFQFVITTFLNSIFKQRKRMEFNYAQLLVELVEKYPQSKILVFGPNKEMTANIQTHYEGLSPNILLTPIDWSWIRSSESRGIDLSEYNICLIAGLPFPPLNDILVAERLINLKKEFGEREGWRIFQSDIIKETIQSFCRLLRKPDDKALVILGDPRFTQRGYQRLFPWYYQERMKTCSSVEDLLELTEQFFGNF